MQNDVAPSPAVPKLTPPPSRACKRAAHLDKEVLLAAELVVQVLQVGFFDLLVSALREKSKEKALAC